MLDAALAAYVPTRRGEVLAKQRMRALLVAGGDSLARSAFSPGHFTASAIVLSPDSAQLLLIHHARLQRWLQPGGHVESSDRTLADAALRELTEETGLSVVVPVGGGIFDLDVHVIPARGSEPSHAHFDVRYLFRARTWELRAGSGVHAARWVPLAQVQRLEADDSVVGVARKLGEAPHAERGCFGASS